VLCLNCGYDLAKGKKLTTAIGVVEATDGLARLPASALSGADKVIREMERRAEVEREVARKHRIVEWVVPIVMLAVGPPALIVAAFVFMGSWLGGAEVAGLLIAVELLLMMPLLLLSLVMAAYIGGISFGSLWSALLKVAALSWGPGAIADVVLIFVVSIIGLTGGAVGMFLGAMAVIAVYTFILGPPLAFLFDLDFQETRITIGFVTIVRTLSLVVVLVIWQMLF
jgi:hypothetical protein